MSTPALDPNDKRRSDEGGPAAARKLEGLEPPKVDPEVECQRRRALLGELSALWQELIDSGFVSGNESTIPSHLLRAFLAHRNLEEELELSQSDALSVLETELNLAKETLRQWNNAVLECELPVAGQEKLRRDIIAEQERKYLGEDRQNTQAGVLPLDPDGPGFGPGEGGPERGDGYPRPGESVELIADTLFLRNDAEVFVMCWRPLALTSRGAEIELRVEADKLEGRTFVDLKREIAEGATGAGSSPSRPLESGFFRTLLKYGKLQKITNVRATGVILLAQHFADNVQFTNVRLIDSFVEIGEALTNEVRTAKLSICRLGLENSTLAAHCTDSEFKKLKLDKNSILLGDLGNSILRSDCQVHGYAIGAVLNQVIFEGFDNFQDFKKRFKGMKFSWDKVKAEVFCPEVARHLSAEELRTCQRDLNLSMPPEKIMTALRQLGEGVIDCGNTFIAGASNQPDGTQTLGSVNVLTFHFGRDCYELFIPFEHATEPCTLYRIASPYGGLNVNLLSGGNLRAEAVFAVAKLYYSAPPGGDERQEPRRSPVADEQPASEQRPAPRVGTRRPGLFDLDEASGAGVVD